jgi:GNAT superfamily N-acetyltransferase
VVRASEPLGHSPGLWRRVLDLGLADMAVPEEEGVGGARYLRRPEPPEPAEAAVAVAHAWQGRGLGSLLLERLVARAEANGVSHFCAALLATNHAVRRLFERVGRVTVVRQGGGTLEVDVELPLAGDAPKVALREAARRRAHLAE